MSNLRSMRRRMARATRIDPRPAGVAALHQGRLNAYRCPACQGYTVTVDLHAGVTPSTLACRATDGCEGTGFSLGYPLPEAWPIAAPTRPGWEWYRPGEQHLSRLRSTDPDAYQHVVKGGMLLRPYGARHGHQVEPDQAAPAPAIEPVPQAPVITEEDLTITNEPDLLTVIDRAAERAAWEAIQ